MRKHKFLLATLLIATMVACTACGSTSTYDSAYSESAPINAATDSFSGAGSIDYAVNSISDTFDVDTSYKSSNQGYKAEEYDDYAEDIQDEEIKDNEVKETEVTLVEEKLVYHCDTEIETKNFENSYLEIKALIEEYGGIIQNERQTDNDYNWYYSDHVKNASLRSTISCRIPSKNYKEFVDRISNLGDDCKLTSKNTSIDNISQQYYDSKTRVQALEIQESRLLEMMDKASTIEEMITVEKRLTEVQYELNTLKTEIIYMDMDVAYSYVNITLKEVKEYTTIKEETTFFSRVWDSVKNAWELAVTLLEQLIEAILSLIPITLFVIIPTILILIAMIKLLWFILKKLDRKATARNFLGKLFIGDNYKEIKYMDKKIRQTKVDKKVEDTQTDNNNNEEK